MRASLFCLLVVIVGCLAKIDPTPLINATYPRIDKDALITSVLTFEANVVVALDDNTNMNGSIILLFNATFGIADTIAVDANCDSSLFEITNDTFVYLCSPDLSQGANVTVIIYVIGFSFETNNFTILQNLTHTFNGTTEAGLIINTPVDNYVTSDGLLYMVVEDFLNDQNTSLVVYNTSSNEIEVLCPDVNAAAGLNASADMSLFTVSQCESALWFLSDNTTMFLYNLTSGNFSNVTVNAGYENYTSFGLFRYDGDNIGFLSTDDLTFVAASFNFSSVDAFGDSITLNATIEGNIWTVENKVFVPASVNASVNFTALSVYEIDIDTTRGFNTGYFNVTVPDMDGSEGAVIAAAWNVLIVAGYELAPLNMSMNGTEANNTMSDMEGQFPNGGYLLVAYSFV